MTSTTIYCETLEEFIDYRIEQKALGMHVGVKIKLLKRKQGRPKKEL